MAHLSGQTVEGWEFGCDYFPLNKNEPLFWTTAIGKTFERLFMEFGVLTTKRPRASLNTQVGRYAN